LEGRFCLDEPADLVEGDLPIEDGIRKIVANFTPINNCSNIATDKVGLMTFEDYIYSLDGTNGILGALGGSYIDEDELTWTITKYTLDGSTNKPWHIYHKNPAHIEYDYHGTNDYGKAVRPVIYISSKVKIEENNESNYGTIYNPYRLLGEQKLKKGYSLNGVTIGSYIYLSEENNPNNSTIEYITSRLNYSYNLSLIHI